jgi:hypothetical protein
MSEQRSEAGGVREHRERTIGLSVLVPHALAERSEAGA